MTTYISDATLQTALAGRLASTWADMVRDGPQWEEIVSTANTDAYNEIRSALVNRGFTVAVIDTWDRRAEFNRKLGLCNALVEGAIKTPVDMEAIDKVCKCRDELQTVPILVGGVEVNPNAATGAGVSRGDMTGCTADNVFSSDMSL